MEPRAYALTTIDRVRNIRLRIESDGFDDLFANLINAVSDFIEGECNRKFMETEYEESHTIHTYGQKIIVLRHAPVSEVTKIEYRSGTKINPVWNIYDPNSWELDEEAGIIETNGIFEKFLKVSYTAGYLIDWENYDDEESHTLPSDITDLAERIVVKWYKRREAEGKLSEGFDGAQIAWRDDLNKDDQATINRYRRIPVLS